MKIVGVGDNVLDKYVDQGLMYPGGNAVNVPVLALRYGAEAAAYIGALGNDRGGRWLREALVREGLDVSRTKILPENNAYSRVTLMDGDRIFVGSEKGASSKLHLSQEDLDYIGAFDVVHTSIYSNIEGQLKEIRAKSRILAFDFSNECDAAYLRAVADSVDYAFFSGAKMGDPEIETLFSLTEELGVALSLVTRGSKGAILRLRGRTYRQDAVPCEVVDTLGAGDAFIARLILGIVSGGKPQAVLEESARCAAAACSHYGAFGYPKPF